ncbi:hypothetical protein K470DRAFT_256871 [Piedraia hortae CBS 480.64]|uniref:Protein YAE1 n=1 Tax=Piedraia hortae CBS 480.64 TaxID=1314780 RepID=A0A6A7C442_9PEZI|nr:hypothetical protein K470DRAFT_256871 [Piedraia hortae CBS 480.64]
MKNPRIREEIEEFDLMQITGTFAEDGDDVWDNQPLDEVFAVESEGSEIPRLRRTHMTDGYREGLAQGKEMHVQEGFDEGYRFGIEVGLQAGWCLGILTELREFSSQSKEDDLKQKDTALPEELSLALSEAEKELAVAKLLGSEYFENGLPRWCAVDAAGELPVHPMVAKWRSKVVEWNYKVGLVFTTPT